MKLMLNSSRTTESITKELNYIETGSAFFDDFKDAVKNVKKQILKLETRQFYDESISNESWNLWEVGKKEEAMSILPRVRSVDLPLYADQRARKIDFIRSRPVIEPISEYLAWEIQVYHFNSAQGEKIYFFDGIKHSDLLKTALHDFMVFSDQVAFIHDYDENGLIRGGWKTEDKKVIQELTDIYSKIQAVSVGYKDYLESMR